jgi:hypothetical protein
MVNPRLAYVLTVLVAGGTTQSGKVPVHLQAPLMHMPASETYEALLYVPSRLRAPPTLPESLACAAPLQVKKLRGKLDLAVVKTAQEQINLPMGSGRYLSVNSKTYLFCLEPHYHEPGSGRGPDGWHKGVTVYDIT